MSDNANLYQRNGIWWCKFKVRGHPIRRSLRTRSVIVARKRRDQERAKFQQYRFDGSERHTWKGAVIEWAQHAPSSLRPGSIARYKASLRVVRQFLDDKYVDEINMPIIAKIAHRAGVSNTTRRRDLTAVSDVLRFCVSQGWREDNPARTYDRSVIRERRPPFIVPPQQDLDDLIAAGPAMWGKAIEFALVSGMREEELFSLEQIQILPDGIQLTNTKTNSPRMVPWMGNMREIVDRLPTYMGSRFLFWHHEGQRYHNLASQFLRIRKQANKRRMAQDPKATAITLTFHGLRHVFAIRWLRGEGRDRLPTLTQIMGHSSVKQTEQYLAYVTPEGGTKSGTVERQV